MKCTKDGASVKGGGRGCVTARTGLVVWFIDFPCFLEHDK